MKRSIVLLLCTLPLTSAHAKNHKWLIDGAKSVAISETVELDMYRGEATDGLPVVAGSVPGDTDEDRTQLLVAFRMGGGSEIGDSMLEELGLKDKKGYATIPELHLGDVVLYDVRVKTGGSVDLVLSTPAIDEITWGFLPSKGVVALAPSMSSGELLGAYGGGVDAVRETTKKYFEHGAKKSGDGISMYVPGKIGDSEGLVLVSTFQDVNYVAPPHAGGDVERYADGDRYVTRSVSVSGVDVDESWFYLNGAPSFENETVVGTLGIDSTYALDIVVSGADRKIAVAKAPSVKYSDPYDLLVKWAREDFAKAEEEAKEAETDDEEDVADPDAPDEGDEAAVTRHTDLARILWSAGSTRDAMRHYQKAADNAGDNCRPYQVLGRVQLFSGDPESAVGSLTKAGELYDKWWSQDLELREKIKADKALGEDLWTLAQPSNCHTAWGDLAKAQLALGDTKGVAENFESHIDLDPDLPQLYGLSMMSKGDWKGANGALRRAINLRDHHDDALRVALGFVNASDGRAEVMASQIDTIARGSIEVPLTTILTAIEFARQLGGDEAAAETAQKFADANPMSVTARIGLAVSTEGDDRAKAVKGLVAAAKTDVDRMAGTPESYGNLAVAHALAGDTDGATAALKKAADAGSLGADYRVAKAQVAGISGDEDKALEAYAQLARLFPHVPMPKAWMGEAAK